MDTNYLALPGFDLTLQLTETPNGISGSFEIINLFDARGWVWDGHDDSRAHFSRIVVLSSAHALCIEQIRAIFKGAGNAVGAFS